MLKHTLNTTHALYRRCAPALQRLRNALLPVRCLACGGGISRPWLDAGLPCCNRCADLLKPDVQVRCQQCALPLGPRPQAFGWIRCRHCRAAPDEALFSVVCHNYTTPADLWLLQMKYGRRPELAGLLGTWLARALDHAGKHVRPDLLVPVPMHPDKQRQRGYNQADLLARAVALHTGIALDTELLRRASPSASSQSRKGRQARLAWSDNPFRCQRAIQAGLRIGLVDDVMTTQATMQACMDALRKAGATHFTLMAVCRTPEE